MNMFKKNGGFTLVELIVVIAILAILAGVAVPVYSGYISKANEAADYTALDSVKTAAVFLFTERQVAANKSNIGVTSITVDADSVTVTNGTESYDLTTAEMQTLTNFPVAFKTTGKTGATWNSTDAKWTLTPTT